MCFHIHLLGGYDMRILFTWPISHTSWFMLPQPFMTFGYLSAWFSFDSQGHNMLLRSFLFELDMLIEHKNSYETVLEVIFIWIINKNILIFIELIVFHFPFHLLRLRFSLIMSLFSNSCLQVRFLPISLFLYTNTFRTQHSIYDA